MCEFYSRSLPPLQSRVHTHMHAVIQDIVGQMFDSRCVQELFRPAKVFTKKSLSGVFAQLAHASIMKLNSTAMEKVSTP